VAPFINSATGSLRVVLMRQKQPSQDLPLSLILGIVGRAMEILLGMASQNRSGILYTLPILGFPVYSSSLFLSDSDCLDDVFVSQDVT